MAGRPRKKLGRVMERPGRPGRFRIDFGSLLPERFVYSVRGRGFRSREHAEEVLAELVEAVARGRALEDVLAELSPRAASFQSVDSLLARWLALFRRRVEVGDRQPRTLRELERWARPGGHFSWWDGRGLGDVSRAAVEEWSLWLATERRLSPKSRRNVLAGFHSFLSWVADDVRPGFAVPRFPWPELDDRQPTVLSEEAQIAVLDAIPWPKRGIFLAMAHCLVRPSEARALRVRDWDPEACELRVTRAAKDRRVRGIVRGLKARNVKVLPVVDTELYGWLLEHVPAERRVAEPDGPLCPNPDGHEEGWWSETAMRRTWAGAAKRAGFPGVGLYEGTKHSTATRLKALGADDRVLASLMGHRDQRSVRFYAGLDSTALRKALARLHRTR
jgi:integrase